ncbi:MAG: hypothetical protein EOQ82_32155 [Mesorhizobium sp.]|nr:MAG: hypothetical protein EOQ82_32155 [Mesorhizobium sp.]
MTVRLQHFGWGAERLAKEFAFARDTVRRYLREGGTFPFRKACRLRKPVGGPPFVREGKGGRLLLFAKRCKWCDRPID